MRHSIRTKISLMILACMLCMVAIIVFMNTMFLDKFYLSGKEKQFEVAYHNVNDYLGKYNAGELSADEFTRNLEMITARNNISIMLLNNDWTIIYASMRDVDEFRKRLESSLFAKIFAGGSSENDNSNAKLIMSSDAYDIYEIYNKRMDDTYLELIGNTSDGRMVYMTLAIKSINDNVMISNHFITYVGIATAIVAAFVAFMLGTVIAKPVKKLSVIAEKMSELDFDVSYDSNDKSEIGILGNSMNKLSAKLESTISELKTANIQLQRDIETKEQVDEMRKEFLSNVSHELKTPIALIQGYAEGLKEGISDDPENINFYCDVIMDEASKMNSMVKSLLSLNQIEFGKDQLEMERFDLVEVTRAVIDAKRILADQQNVTIKFDNTEPINVWADEYKIEEVITNYLTNAIHYCCRDNRIEVKIELQDGVARTSVFNSGNPIPEEELDNIWLKFYKVDKARTREYGGSGIGLSIVRAIMEQHNRKYGVINHEDGVEFWFELDAKI